MDMNNQAQMTAGRRLWQAMLTEQLHGRREAATQLMGTATDILELFAALNISVAAIAEMLKMAIPHEETRNDFLIRFMTSFEAANG